MRRAAGAESKESVLKSASNAPRILLGTSSIRTTSATKLLDAAEELFFSHGIHATPVDAVIERAGVSAATMYRGYASKEALLAATLARRQDEWLETWDAAIARQETREGRILAVFDALDTFRGHRVRAQWCAFLGAAAEYADAPTEVRDAIDTESLRGRLTASIAGDATPSPEDGELAEHSC